MIYFLTFCLYSELRNDSEYQSEKTIQHMSETRYFVPVQTEVKQKKGYLGDLTRRLLLLKRER